MKPFTGKLLPHQVPDYPERPCLAVDLLRWLSMVMDEDDLALPFVVSVYNYSLHNNGDLTERQAETVKRIADRISEAWYAGELECCQKDDLEPRADNRSV